MRPEIDVVKEWLDYDPIAGHLIRKKKLRWDVADIIKPAKRLWFLRKRYTYSHLIWVIYYGKWPNEMIDHEDHNQLNFKIDNLREATASQNQHNKMMRNPLGKGVAYDGSVPRSKPWVARIMIKNKSIYLGSFETSEEAHEAYRQAAIKYHGEFACLE